MTVGIVCQVSRPDNCKFYWSEETLSLASSLYTLHPGSEMYAKCINKTHSYDKAGSLGDGQCHREEYTYTHRRLNSLQRATCAFPGICIYSIHKLKANTQTTSNWWLLTYCTCTRISIQFWNGLSKTEQCFVITYWPESPPNMAAFHIITDTGKVDPSFCQETSVERVPSPK